MQGAKHLRSRKLHVLSVRILDLIDIEASGLHWDSYPVEIAVRVRGQVHSWLIAPAPGWTYWDPAAERLHGLTRDQLEREGLQAPLVARELNLAVEGARGILYSDAAPWDWDWLDKLFEKAGETPRFHVHSIEELLTDSEYRQFIRVRQQLADSGRFRAHRAEEDLQIIQEAYAAVRSTDSPR